MLQNPCKTLGFTKNMVYKIPPGGGEVNHIQPVAYSFRHLKRGIQDFHMNYVLVPADKAANNAVAV